MSDGMNRRTFGATIAAGAGVAASLLATSDAGAQQASNVSLRPAMPGTLPPAPMRHVPVVAALRGLPGTAQHTVIHVAGGAAPSDGGGGLFAWAAVAPRRDDGVTCFVVGSGAWVRQFSGPLDVRWFGATGNGTTDDTAALQRALNYSSANKRAVLLPAGTYRTTATLTLGRDTRVMGEGKTLSTIRCEASGPDVDALRCLSPINASTAVNTLVEHLTIRMTATHTRACYYDRGGSFVYLRHVSVSGARFGIVFDQSEVAHIADSNISALSTADGIGAGVWLVNGDELSAGASGNYTNAISISGCQIDVRPDVIGLIDDGGIVRTIEKCNFNGSRHLVWMAGARQARYSGCEFEGGAGDAGIVLSTYGGVDGSKLKGLPVNATFAACLIAGGATGPLFSVRQDNPGVFNVSNAGPLVFENCELRPLRGHPCFGGTKNIAHLVGVGSINTGTGPVFDAVNPRVSWTDRHGTSFGGAGETAGFDVATSRRERVANFTSVVAGANTIPTYQSPVVRLAAFTGAARAFTIDGIVASWTDISEYTPPDKLAGAPNPYLYEGWVNPDGTSTPLTNLDGLVLEIQNATGRRATIVHDSHAARPANRIDTLTGSNVRIGVRGFAKFRYDGPTSRWLLIDTRG